MCRYTQNIFIFVLTFNLVSFITINSLSENSQKSQIQNQTKNENDLVIQTSNQVKQVADKFCSCKEYINLNEAISCEPIEFKNGAKLYRNFNCDSSWLTFEDKDGNKKILDSLEKDFIELTTRLGYQFEYEYENTLLFQNRQASGGGFPIDYELLDIETGEVVEEFGAIIYYSDKAERNFILYLSAKSLNTLIYYDIDSKTKHKFSIPHKRIERTDAMFPTFLFEKPKIKNNILKLTYKYTAKNRRKNWEKDTIIFDLKKIKTVTKPIDKKQSVEKTLKKYLSKHEIKPLITKKNDFDGGREERKETIKLSNHIVTWFHSVENTKIKIDDDLFSFKKELSINDTDGGGKIKGTYVNNWDEIKFYKVNGRKLIAIRMYPDFCTGLMCSVSLYLVYDLKTKSKNFFGDFRTGIEMKLYDFGSDGTIDFLSTKNNFTYTPGFEIKHTYNFYTLDKKGIFKLQKSNNQKPFFIKRVFSSDNDKEFADKFEQSWIEKIK